MSGVLQVQKAKLNFETSPPVGILSEQPDLDDIVVWQDELSAGSFAPDEKNVFGSVHRLVKYTLQYIFVNNILIKTLLNTHSLIQSVFGVYITN